MRAEPRTEAARHAASLRGDRECGRESAPGCTNVGFLVEDRIGTTYRSYMIEVFGFFMLSIVLEFSKVKKSKIVDRVASLLSYGARLARGGHRLSSSYR